MIETLFPYVELIKDDKLRLLCYNIIEQGQEQLKMPSSSSGKYHPKDELQEYGQVIHLKKAVNLILHAIRRDKRPLNVDIAVTIALLHDLPKKFNLEISVTPGQSRMNKNHGWDNAVTIDKEAEKLGIDYKTREIIFDAIAQHMGKWTPEGSIHYRPNGELMLHTPYVEYLQEADYFASRRNVMVDYSFEITQELYEEVING